MNESNASHQDEQYIVQHKDLLAQILSRKIHQRHKETDTKSIIFGSTGKLNLSPGLPVKVGITGTEF